MVTPKQSFESFDIAIRHGSKPIWKLTETMLQKLSRKQRMRSKPIMSAVQLDLFAFRPHSPELNSPISVVAFALRSFSVLLTSENISVLARKVGLPFGPTLVGNECGWYAGVKIMQKR
jgi:hypothetical protein